MKKRDRNQSEHKVVLFPNLEKRLMEKGLDCLTQKKYQQAIQLLEEAKQYTSDHEEIYIGLIVGYYETGNLQEAKRLAKEVLHKGLGDYIHTVDLYLMILVQLHEYEEIVSTIEVLLEEKEVPAEKLEHFSKLLHFSKRMVDSQGHLSEEEENGSTELPNLLSVEDPNEQMLIIAQLQSKNIRPYIEQIEAYLTSDSGHPFMKTMLINLLVEQEYNKEIIIKKLNREDKMNPVHLPVFGEFPQMKAIVNELQQQVENENPVLYGNIVSLVERHCFITYPFALDPDNVKAWAAAYHIVGNEFFGIKEETCDIIEQYQAQISDVEEIKATIYKLEEISFPII
ncbi:tetratricopeptide repeat protein [Cytobacillus spongiae]|uniref:tetratricopeptide repeat protein n=1 Tax=Cytobacillus spongiae TaxID=2901381 RepID=UPI001F35B9B0|nr:tetratricopeptide repeat protein [Cytobacillus spongiae]UII55078.1 tetratricopeptide repeat protein [Cytobacillus spongiae]